MGRSDAGLRDLDHCTSFLSSTPRQPLAGTISNVSPPLDRNRLPFWRYRLRRWLISLMRWETPFLAQCQVAVRHPALDSYFAITANLGTHTFYMVGLPVLFWCGYTSLGRAYVIAMHQVRTLISCAEWYMCWRRVYSSVASSRTCCVCPGPCLHPCTGSQCHTRRPSNMAFLRPTRPMPCPS